MNIFKKKAKPVQPTMQDTTAAILAMTNQMLAASK